ncbi:RNA-binding protein [Neisseria gonorrhoeae]|uniref:Dual-specificity RNA pseudouridine synthase RluF n=1 Tax=Neisseria gonorrhoeae TaxID=485 RepID=A0A378W0F1_NEIGO|nr:RNA-binding protein [Neisseria gonorrhoeae]
MNSKISSDHTEDTIRLSKRMAQLGLCSRREADGHIEQGWVTVNGKTAVLGQKVSPADRIELNKKAHEQQAARITILLNKPVGYVSAQAEKGYKSAAELITPEIAGKATPAASVSIRNTNRSCPRRQARYRFSRIAGVDARRPYRQAAYRRKQRQ